MKRTGLTPNVSDNIEKTTLNEEIKPILDDSDAMKVHSHHHITKNDKIGIVLLLVLYLFQGLPLGLFAGTIKLILAEEGANLADLAAFSIVSCPFSFKILFAPILDTYFFKNFGKRKTYIVPLQYLYGILSIVLAWNIDELVQLNHITKLTFIGLLALSIMALQDIAVDGWVLTLLSPGNVSYGSTCQSVGQSLGIVISYNLLVPLSSVKFCNSYIYSVPQNTPLVTLSSFCLVFGIIIIAVNFLIHFFKKEINPPSHEYESIVDVLKIFKGFISNKNLKYLIILHLTWRIGFAPIEAIIVPKLIQKGLSKDVITNISTLVMPLQFLNSVIMGRLCRGKKELAIWMTCFKIRIFQVIFLYMILYYSDNISDWSSITILIFISTIVDTITSNSTFVAFGAFHNRISDPSTGGTFLTTCAALLNFGRQWTETTSLFIENYIEWKLLGIIGIIYSLVFLVINHKKILNLQEKDKSQYSVKNQSKLKILLISKLELKQKQEKVLLYQYK